MNFEAMDIREMNYRSDYFDLIIDKSTIDALVCSKNPAVDVALMLMEC